jgi:hypothetical protein
MEESCIPSLGQRSHPTDSSMTSQINADNLMENLTLPKASEDGVEEPQTTMEVSAVGDVAISSSSQDDDDATADILHDFVWDNDPDYSEVSYDEDLLFEAVPIHVEQRVEECLQTQLHDPMDEAATEVSLGEEMDDGSCVESYVEETVDGSYDGSLVEETVDGSYDESYIASIIEGTPTESGSLKDTPRVASQLYDSLIEQGATTLTETEILFVRHTVRKVDEYMETREVPEPTEEEPVTIENDPNDLTLDHDERRKNTATPEPTTEEEEPMVTECAPMDLAYDDATTGKKDASELPSMDDASVNAEEGERFDTISTPVETMEDVHHVGVEVPEEDDQEETEEELQEVPEMECEEVPHEEALVQEHKDMPIHDLIDLTSYEDFPEEGIQNDQPIDDNRAGEFDTGHTGSAMPQEDPSAIPTHEEDTTLLQSMLSDATHSVESPHSPPNGIRDNFDPACRPESDFVIIKCVDEVSLFSNEETQTENFQQHSSKDVEMATQLDTDHFSTGSKPESNLIIIKCVEETNLFTTEVVQTDDLEAPPILEIHGEMGSSPHTLPSEVTEDTRSETRQGEPQPRMVERSDSMLVSMEEALEGGEGRDLADGLRSDSRQEGYLSACIASLSQHDELRKDLFSAFRNMGRKLGRRKEAKQEEWVPEKHDLELNIDPPTEHVVEPRLEAGVDGDGSFSRISSVLLQGLTRNGTQLGAIAKSDKHESDEEVSVYTDDAREEKKLYISPRKRSQFLGTSFTVPSAASSSRRTRSIYGDASVDDTLGMEGVEDTLIDNRSHRSNKSRKSVSWNEIAEVRFDDPALKGARKLQDPDYRDSKDSKDRLCGFLYEAPLWLKIVVYFSVTMIFVSAGILVAALASGSEGESQQSLEPSRGWIRVSSSPTMAPTLAPTVPVPTPAVTSRPPATSDESEAETIAPTTAPTVGVAVHLTAAPWVVDEEETTPPSPSPVAATPAPTPRPRPPFLWGGRVR